MNASLLKRNVNYRVIIMFWLNVRKREMQSVIMVLLDRRIKRLNNVV